MQPGSRPVDPRRSHPSLLSAWFLPAVLALGALLRFTALHDRGLLYWDEAKFALEGMRLSVLANALLHGHLVNVAGKTIGTAKPTHALLIAASYTVLGRHDYAPLYMDAVCSLMAIVALYAIGARLFGPAVGLVAALLLSVSEYDVMYARSALSESDATFVFLLGVLVLLWGRSQSTSRGEASLRVAAALLFGLAFTINYRLSIYVAAVVAFDLVDGRLRRTWAAAARSGALWIAGIATCPMVWQGLDLVARSRGVVLFQSEITHRETTYIGEVLYQLHGGKQSIVRFDPVVYLQWYATRQSWFMLGLLVAGLAVAVRHRGAAWLLPAWLVLLPYGVYCFAPFIVPRNLDTTLPFSSLLIAAVTVTTARRLTHLAAPRIAIWTAALALALFGATLSWRLTAERSGFAEAARYLQHHHDDGAMVDSEVLAYYLRDGVSGCDAPRIAGSVPALARADAAEYDYAVVTGYDTPADRLVRTHAQLSARFPAAGSLSLGENPIASENGLPPGAELTQSVDVYRLSALHVRVEKHPRLVCNLNQIE